ncbi:MAG: hypothetical protein ACYSUQ_06735 [Planctomycetota bacterium]|jgi:hypothetical protein
MNTRTGTVECAEHGTKQATFVCQHIFQGLRDGRMVDFFWAEDPDNPRPDAWCAACEERVQSTGGEWTDESEAFAGVTLLCGACYDRAKALWQSSRE